MKSKKKIAAFLLCILLIIPFSLPSYAVDVIAGGMPFGVKVSCEGIYIVGIGDISVAGKKLSPARDAGLSAGDIITDIDNTPVRDVETLQKAIRESDGRTMTLTVRRADSQFCVNLSPTQADDGHYRTGMWIRDSIAGIGTVSFIDQKTGAFAGLGHGISHAESGELVDIIRGVVCNVTIEGVVRGEAGVPGELKGFFSSGKIGTLLGNTNCGVWGVFAELPPYSDCIVPTADPEDVTEGEAELLCTTDSGGIGHYKVYLTNIDHTGKPTKNFIVTVTDETLIAKTGGIVQGMSGSPILQNGRLVGAVTHVLVNDPKRGYGIFVRNMLEMMG